MNRGENVENGFPDSRLQPNFPVAGGRGAPMLRSPISAMPTYEYACSKCEKTFEVFQSMKDKPLTKCPDKACRGRVKRLLGTGAGLIFKGSGFYITDYRSEGYKSAAKSDASPPASGSSDTSAKSSGGDSGGTASPAAGSKSTAKSTPSAKPVGKPKKQGS